MNIGVLAFQGGFKEHIAALSKLGIFAVEIRLPEQLGKIDGLVLPGGESTVMMQFLQEYGFQKKLSTVPLFGTCAGCIALAKLGLLNISVERNAYGSQLDSFEDTLQIKNIGNFRGIFIRAPKITAAGKNTEVLAEHDGSPVLLQQGNMLASTFHPELTEDTRIHKMFIESICGRKLENNIQVKQ